MDKRNPRLQLAPDIPALDTPAFSDWLRGVSTREPKHVRRGYAAVNLVPPNIRQAIRTVAKGYVQSKEPKHPRQPKRTQHAPKREVWSLPAPSREDVARAEKRGLELRDADPYEASVDTLPAPLRAVVTELDARIAREFGGGE